MNILLTTLNSKFVHNNLALKYLYHTINKDFNVKLKEFTINEELFKILANIMEVKADIIAFSCYIWNITYTLKLCEIIKQVRPKTVIIFGGPEVSHHTRNFLSKYNFIDFVVMGEGEETFPKLINAVISDVHLIKDINGIAYRDEKRDIIVNGVPEIVKDLSLVPSPYLENLTEYNQKIVYFESSRGCPYNCSYCLSSTSKGVRYFPMERTKQELKNLIEAGVKQVKFVDRTFNSNKKRALEIWQFIIENNKKSSFHFEISGHLLDDEILEFLAKVPERYFDFEIGVQSTNEETICSINRKTDFSKLAAAVKKLRDKNNIHIHLDLIAGLPYETFEIFRQSFDEVYNLNPHVLQLGFLKLLKGSQIREKSDNYGYKFIINPPYEVLENKFISFDELIRLKRIEEVLEIYNNSGRFENSLKYIIDNFYESAFELFEDISEYWLEKGAFNRKIGSEEAYDIIFNFYAHCINKKMNYFRDILKLDYLINLFGARKRLWMKNYKYKDMKKLIKNILSEDEYIDQYIPYLNGIPLGERIKRVHFEIFGSDVIDNIENNAILIMFKRNIEKKVSKTIRYFKVDEKYYDFTLIIEEDMN